MPTRVRIVVVLAGLVRAATAADDGISARAYGVLSKNCFTCHGAAKTAGLDLRTGQSALAGSAHGAVIVPFQPADSRLIKLVSHSAQPAMPPGKKLSDEDVDTLRAWIQAGASSQGWSRVEDPPDRPITPEERNYWAFRPPKRVGPPKITKPGWSANPMDAFLLAAMQSPGLKSSPRADRRTLIRRAYLDLLGLPPAPEEVEAFLKDRSPDAWPKLIDKLLASPHYGERWARHWLDLVRYADSDGFEFDRDRPEAWRYRDYVTKAFNGDKPYDRFIREQIAGDEYAGDLPTAEARDAMVATGFLRLGPSGGGGGERGKQESLDDIVTTTSMTFLGMTVGCARCHDHKFDPIRQADYYRIQAVFYSTRPLSYPLADEAQIAAYNTEVARLNKLEAPLKRAKNDLESPYRKRLMDEAISRLPAYMQEAWRTPPQQRTEGQKLNVQQIQRTLTNDTLAHRIEDSQVLALMTEEERRKDAELSEQIAALQKQKPAPFAAALATTDSGRTPQPSYFLHRGGIDAKGALMTPGVLSAAAAAEYRFPSPPENAKTTWRRRGFAEWIASPANPLTARVMVNRLWQHHFGEGIVRTPSNFGKMGESPSHPELLDWLAAEFIARGWSIKAMHRLMMNSEAYQMASSDIQANLEIDSENRFFWRMPRERLEAEIIRDEILAVAGTLDRQIGGPCVFPYISPDLFQSSTNRTWPGKADDDPSTWRRSLYVFSKRSIRYPMFEAYDQPNLVNTCDRRNHSTIAPQALLLMNNNFVIEQAKHFASRLAKEAGGSAEAQVDRAFALALGRPPSPAERAQSAAYIRSGPEGLAGFCQAMFNLNEFVYRQ
ncbi:MAG TPA: PSD1 and planctomycete cytochrome C domain-containing protein [Candidatus Solibacter sp.]|nr:PSD1 and planctomycete cytochrome C domain-containing protein [Candidatus Solibacter sp.]